MQTIYDAYSNVNTLQGMRQGWSRLWRLLAQQWRFWGTPESSWTRLPRQATRGDLFMLHLPHGPITPSDVISIC